MAAGKNINDFRAQHQEKINTASRRASDLNKKYNVTGRLNNFLEKHTSPTASPTAEQAQPATLQQPVAAGGVNGAAAAGAGGVGVGASPEMSASIARKPPPPPPPKKPAGMHAPPPVPLGTRPSLGS